GHAVALGEGLADRVRAAHPGTRRRAGVGLGHPPAAARPARPGDHHGVRHPLPRGVAHGLVHRQRAAARAAHPLALPRWPDLVTTVPTRTGPPTTPTTHDLATTRGVTD